MLAFACFIQRQTVQASRPERSDAKHEGSNQLPPSTAGIVLGGEVCVPSGVQDASPPSSAQAAATPAVARLQRHLAPVPTRLQRMPDLLWCFIVRHWRTMMVVYAFGSFFLRFCEEFGQLGEVSARPSQPEFASGSIMYLDMETDLQVPLTWASFVPSRMAHIGIPPTEAAQKSEENKDSFMKKSRGMRSWTHADHEGVTPPKAAPRDFKENTEPVMKKRRTMKSWNQVNHEGVRGKSYSHQALVYMAMALSPLALALACALVFTSPGVSTA